MAKSTTTTVKSVLTEQETVEYLKVHKETFGEIFEEKKHCTKNDKRYEEPFEDDGAYAD